MTPDEALVVFNAIIQPNTLTPTQELVLRQCWGGTSYHDIAQRSGLTTGYLRTQGAKLWDLLASKLGQNVSKSNVRAILRQQAQTSPIMALLKAHRHTTNNTDTQHNPHHPETNNTGTRSEHQSNDPFRVPSGPLPPQSTLYIERPNVENIAYQALHQPSIINIQAPKKMGKTSLMLRLLDYAQSLNMTTVRLNLAQAEHPILKSSNTLLQWVCANIAQQLGLKINPAQKWNEQLGSHYNATRFLQEYGIKKRKTPLTIAFDEVNWLFQYPPSAFLFLQLLRAWHQEAIYQTEWAQLRIIVVLSTDKYPPSDTLSTLLNIGLPIQLKPFQYEQALVLATLHQHSIPQNWTLHQLTQRLYALLRGHPFLLMNTFYHLTKPHTTIEDIINHAPTHQGIYDPFLKPYLISIQKHPHLADALNTLLDDVHPVYLNIHSADQFYRWGLITFVGNRCQFRCNLYRHYFLDQLGRNGLH